MKIKIVLSLCASFLAAFLLLSVLPVNGEEKIYKDMIRLHVTANSDSVDDQSLKLSVRDAILNKIEEMKMPETKEEAEQKIVSSISSLKKTAEDEIKRHGYNYDVEVLLEKESYPEREYDGFTLPAGIYTSLRVVIGEGKGHNWWCVLYPPLCKTSAEKREDVFISAGFSEEQYRTITETGKTKYKIKFKILEMFEQLFEKEK